ncbi:hypothetical protein G7Y89_g851 [Cudoniella acicularis]|uniref:RING-type domain-containing protein n=1 Tax=Cudoniella acicularis TaxID=354080 RepID=A0A8H4RWF2_9HELO|nr:hypothetical protein G7Y89_g851 [Cudoniella acicularis]
MFSTVVLNAPYYLNYLASRLLGITKQNESQTSQITHCHQTARYIELALLHIPHLFFPAISTSFVPSPSDVKCLDWTGEWDDLPHQKHDKSNRKDAGKSRRSKDLAVVNCCDPFIDPKLLADSRALFRLPYSTQRLQKEWETYATGMTNLRVASFALRLNLRESCSQNKLHSKTLVEAIHIAALVTRSRHQVLNVVTQHLEPLCPIETFPVLDLFCLPAIQAFVNQSMLFRSPNKWRGFTYVFSLLVTSRLQLRKFVAPSSPLRGALQFGTVSDSTDPDVSMTAKSRENSFNGNARKYQYNPLDPSRDSIRLLRLKSDENSNAPINCTLFHTTLSEAPRYVALSYTWGDRSGSRQILIGGEVISVTPNLKHALQRLRRPSGEDLILWVDAICINQENIPERNIQTAGMRRIYQNAESVAVWLGIEYKGSELALELARELNLLQRDEIIDLIKDPARTEHLEALVLLFRRQYWWRIWVIQEVSCAKDATVYCGLEAISWAELDNLSDILREHEIHLRDLFYRSPSYVRTLTHGGPRGLQVSRFSPKLSAPPLLELLLSHKGKKSTDPKDKVYALVGISSSRGTFGDIDYSRSLKDIYTHTARHIISSSHRLDIICVKQHDNGPSSLPSWAPDWTRPPQKYGVLPVGLHHHEPEFQADGNTIAEYKFSSGGDVLEVAGIAIDTITSVGMDFKQKGAHKNVGPALHVFHDWWNLFSASFGDCESLPAQASFGQAISCGHWMFEDISVYAEKLKAIFDLSGNVLAEEDVLHLDMPEYGSLAGSVTSLLEENEEPEEDLGDKQQLSVIINASLTMNRRRFFVSRAGSIGLAPSNAAVGDLICVLLGCRYPVILREVDGHHLLVGEAYVNDFMNGEAMQERLQDASTRNRLSSAPYQHHQLRHSLSGNSEHQLRASSSLRRRRRRRPAAAKMENAAMSEATQRLIEDTFEELSFQKVLLASIDDTVTNREDAEAEVRQEIKTLEKRIKELKRGGRSSASQSSTAASSTSPSRNRSKPAPTANGAASGTVMEGYQARDQWLPRSTVDSMVSTPNSLDSYPELLSPSQMNLPTRKRSHSKHLDGSLAPAYGDNKSRRTSPSPYTTNPSTPGGSSSGEDEMTAFDDFIQQQQKAQEEIRKREKLDEEFARSLQNEAQGFRPSDQPQSSAYTAFSRMSGMRPPASSAPAMPSSSTPQFGQPSVRKLPPGWNSTPPRMAGSVVKPQPQLMNSRVKAEQPSMNSMTSLAAFGGDQSRAIPGSFPDDSSNASDSDIEIIPPEAFRDNGRHSHSAMQNNHRLGFSPAAQTAGAATLRRLEQAATNDALQMAMYGGRQVPSWMSTPAPSSPSSFESSMNSPGSVGMGVYGANMYPGGSFMDGSSGATFGTAGSMNSASMYSGYPGNSMQPSVSSFSFNNLPGGMMADAYGSFQPLDPLANIIQHTSNQQFDNSAGYFNRSFGPISEEMAEKVDFVINDPRKTGDEIRKLLENIRPDVDLPAENREGTPPGLKYALTNLIVGPVALVRQWQREIQQKISASHKLSTLLLHGPKNGNWDWDNIRNYDVVLTTYGTLGHEYKRHSVFMDEKKRTGITEIDSGPLKKLFPLLGPKSLFYRVFLDEAQCIKNKSTMAARAACSIKAIFRICLTGTPMMNNIGELYSLIHFLKIKPYNEWQRFNSEFGALTKHDGRGDVDRAMRKLQAVLKAILLRRTKFSLIDGKPILNLPPKTEEIQHVVFSEDEQAFYEALESKTQIQFNKYLRANTVGRNYSNILVLLLRLRQCCCHPHLITDVEQALPAGADLTPGVMIELAKSLAPDVVGRLLATNGFDCPICLDATENPSIVTPCGHGTCAECLTRIADQTVQQNVANGEETGDSKCPSCRGPMKMSKIIDYETFKKVHVPNTDQDNNDDDETASENSDSEADSNSDSDSEDEDDVNDDGDLKNFIVPDDVDDIEDTEDESDPAKNEDASVTSKNIKGKGKDKSRKRNKKGKKKEKRIPKSLAVLKKEASGSKEGRKRYMRVLKKNWQPSAKVTKCVELLDQFQQEGEKTIVFSQFVSLLDLLQVPIEEKGWKYERYDGSMSGNDRNHAVERFQDNRECQMMLISLKAGNSGLNLVAASRVIILDPFWNPFIEMQAIDRAHRIGQQRPVEVHRILVEGTVEDRIIELQEKKRNSSMPLLMKARTSLWVVLTSNNWLSFSELVAIIRICKNRRALGTEGYFLGCIFSP